MSILTVSKTFDAKKRKTVVSLEDIEVEFIEINLTVLKKFTLYTPRINNFAGNQHEKKNLPKRQK